MMADFGGAAGESVELGVGLHAGAGRGLAVDVAAERGRVVDAPDLADAGAGGGAVAL